ncbi:hypothetical protein KBD87_04160 [Candidatus Saccharibacteria bacterium]|nr:hypothetical protein [Candidatus Saccharibacteria bacterium]
MTEKITMGVVMALIAFGPLRLEVRRGVENLLNQRGSAKLAAEHLSNAAMSIGVLIIMAALYSTL